MTQNEDEKITVSCDCGCGRSLQLRRASIQDGDYVCCRDSYYYVDRFILPLFPGKHRTFTEYKREGGVTFRKIRDVWPSAEMIKSSMESADVWAYTLAEIAIEEAMGKFHTEQEDDLTIDEELAVQAEKDKRAEEFEKSLPKPPQLP
jgi:hypothetical protein